MHAGFYFLFNNDIWLLRNHATSEGSDFSHELLIQLLPKQTSSNADIYSSHAMPVTKRVNSQKLDPYPLLSMSPKPQPSADLPDLTSFIATQYLDRSPVPVSEPDIGSLTLTDNILIPVIARVYIDSKGVVVLVKFSRDLDPESMQQISKMFKNTRFIPGRAGGVDKASFVDIELSITDLQH